MVRGLLTTGELSESEDDEVAVLSSLMRLPVSKSHESRSNNDVSAASTKDGLLMLVLYIALSWLSSASPGSGEKGFVETVIDTSLLAEGGLSASSARLEWGLSLKDPEADPAVVKVPATVWHGTRAFMHRLHGPNGTAIVLVTITGLLSHLSLCLWQRSQASRRDRGVVRGASLDDTGILVSLW